MREAGGGDLSFSISFTFEKLASRHLVELPAVQVSAPKCPCMQTSERVCAIHAEPMYADAP